MRGIFAPILLVLAFSAGFATTAAAHHSFALFYAGGQTVTIKGVVTRFNFRNPHAIIELTVVTDEGKEEHWTGETSAPSALRRRGWGQDSIRPGETLTLVGYQAKDGSHLIRITTATKSDGTVIGIPRGKDN